ncbi:transmembrane protein 255A-like [Polyodon spathula]|uniref:transmembrane protein 255A-like n=1 Tax=Polyodon spathula TaxID=7913 RepID=UPI001B7EC05E|nr:transmembrane protein 255A-like [Polyodon spathula]
MSVLRVSSYRRLFEEEEWGSSPAASLQCGGQYRAAARAGRGVELDFAAARTLNREGLSSCVRDRSLIAALNNRLVNLIETVSPQPSATPVQSDKQQRHAVFSQRSCCPSLCRSRSEPGAGYHEYVDVQSCQDVVHLYHLLWFATILNIVALFLGIVTAAVLGGFKDMGPPLSCEPETLPVPVPCEPQQQVIPYSSYSTPHLPPYTTYDLQNSITFPTATPSDDSQSGSSYVWASYAPPRYSPPYFSPDEKPPPYSP